MKRFFLTITLISTLYIMSSFTTKDSEDVNPTVLQSFKSSFKTATDVNWTSTNNFYKASFSFNNQIVAAYYDGDGKMIALTRNISPENLPIALQASLKRESENMWISDLFELADETGTTYYVTIENGDSRIVLKSNSNTDWSTFSKQHKS